MNKQLSFFQTQSHDGNTTTKLARRNDPETSKQAAEKVKVSANERLFLLVLDRNRHITMTAEEVAAQSVAYVPERTKDDVDSQRKTVRKRSSGLKVKELIGEVSRRPCKITGNPAATFTITKKGRESIR